MQTELLTARHLGAERQEVETAQKSQDILSGASWWLKTVMEQYRFKGHKFCPLV